jgi:hypothetical protein
METAMSQVLDLAFEPPPSPAPRRMVLASRALELLFAALFVLFGLIAAGLMLSFFVPAMGEHVFLGPRGGQVVWNGPAPRGYLMVSGLPLMQRLAHMPIGVLNAAPTLIVLFGLHRLFGLYARGVVFARENAAYLKLIGGGLVFSALAPGLGVFLLTSLGLVIDRVWLHPSTFQALVLGGIVYVIAEVMQLGREIEEDRKGFV